MPSVRHNTAPRAVIDTPGSIDEFTASARLAIAALIGLAIGLERQWSGHASGPQARFAGLRTFLLLGITGGAGGVLLASGFAFAGAVAMAGGMALCVGAYVTTTRRDDASIDGTTEAAALVAVGLGTLAGYGWTALAAGAGSLTVLALREKSRLHWLVGRVSAPELHAALQFAALALVLLPLLPTGPFLGDFALRPRALWSVVLFFCALNFGGFLARRAAGPNAGLALTGLLGGILSSTAVTLDFSRRSRTEDRTGAALGIGTVAACTVLFPRVMVVTAILNPATGAELAWLLALPTACAAAFVALAWRRVGTPVVDGPTDENSPLRLVAAVQMAVAFQVAVTAIVLLRRQWGDLAIVPAAAALGLTDVDALVVSMSGLGTGVPASTAARAIVVGVLANTLLKFTVAAVLGRGRFRRVALPGLLLIAVACALGLLLPAPPAALR